MFLFINDHEIKSCAQLATPYYNVLSALYSQSWLQSEIYKTRGKQIFPPKLIALNIFSQPKVSLYNGLHYASVKNQF